MKKVDSLEGLAFSSYVSMSPLKVSSILDQVRGRSFSEAVMILKFMPYKACPIILKVLLSAVSNLKFSLDVNDSTLFVREASADSGPFLKRFRPHAQGSGFPMKKQMCHMISAIWNWNYLQKVSLPGLLAILGFFNVF